MDEGEHHATRQALVERYLALWCAMHPHVAVNLGLHQYDGRMPDWSAAAIANYLRELNSIRDAIQRVILPLPRHDESLVAAPVLQTLWDTHLVLASVHGEQHRWEVLRPHETNPLTYLAPLDVSPYVKRHYAPLPQRLRALISHNEGIPALLEMARQHLREHLPRLVVEQSISLFEGLARFHAGDLMTVVQRGGDAALFSAFQRTNRQVISAYQHFINHLQSLRRKANDHIALGAPALHGLISSQEGLDIPLDRLLKLGQEDLDRNRARMVAVAGKLGMMPSSAMMSIGKRHPPADQLLAVTRQILQELQGFLGGNDLVSLPADSRCLVQETPPFMRTGSAFMDAPGPFETVATEAYYYLTLPDPTWPVAQREAWLAKQSVPGLANTSIHEAWPGHYLQFLHLAQAPSMAMKMFTCTSFTEGWAHYAEQLMVEAGYHGDDPRFELQQVSMALLRDCRLIVALRLHTEDIAVTEAADFIAREAHFTPIRARQEAIRGARDPSYLNYTLGKLLLLQLRGDLQRLHPDWSSRTMHDTLLRFGAPAIPLLRAMLLGEAASATPMLG